MKLVLLLLPIIITSASATSYWYDYCYPTEDIYKLMQEEFKRVDLPDFESCTKYSAISKYETRNCTQVRVKLKNNLIKSRTTYTVSLRAANKDLYLWEISYKPGKTEDCKITSSKLERVIPHIK